MTMHITPVGDIGQHTEESTCMCSPELKMHNGDMHFVHNAYDKRHILERAIGTENTQEGLQWFAEYCQEVSCLTEDLGHDWVYDKIKSGFRHMYDHWRKMNVEISFE